MPKIKTSYVCSECGESYTKWMGQCTACGAWNSLSELTIDTSKPSAINTLEVTKPTTLDAISEDNTLRISSGMSEFDKTLGGGLVEGSVILLGGNPGIGKSTLILQILSLVHTTHKVLYVTGEESLGQIKNRANRLGIDNDLLLYSGDNIDTIIAHAKDIQPTLMVVDSIQTVMSNESTGVHGSVSQVRNCASILTTYAKHTGTIMIMIGHVTKDGSLAGPRVLEHMVDTVLYFEGDAAGKYRIIRAAKNRFGAVNEMSVFAMLDKGLAQVKNPSSIFLTSETASSGMVIASIYEGTRPMLVEIQALVDNKGQSAKRVAVGFEQNRLTLMLAILSKHGELATHDTDVFINVVGGLKITETASDLAVCLAIYSSLRDIIISKEVIIFGEVGLTGEVRPVFNAQERLLEAKKQGFTRAIIPKKNAPKKSISGLEIHSIERITNALQIVHNM